MKNGWTEALDKLTQKVKELEAENGRLRLLVDLHIKQGASRMERIAELEGDRDSLLELFETEGDEPDEAA